MNNLHGVCVFVSWPAPNDEYYSVLAQGNSKFFGFQRNIYESNQRNSTSNGQQWRRQKIRCLTKLYLHVKWDGLFFSRPSTVVKYFPSPSSDAKRKPTHTAHSARCYPWCQNRYNVIPGNKSNGRNISSRAEAILLSQRISMEADKSEEEKVLFCV